MQSPSQQSNQHRSRRGLGSLVVTLLLLVASVAVWYNRQYIADSISFWQYQPPSGVQTITSRSALTDEGKFVFYAAQPAVDGNRTFNATCDQKEAGTAILGCYVGNRIYIYDVSDKRLDGIKEVTAVHEMLHAVYQRLSAGDRTTVNNLVEAEYTKLKSNPAYEERMAYYARTEPGERDNELHSIIGTEVATVSPELEAYYKKYLGDRSKITGYFAAYNGVFTELSDRAKELSTELDSLNAQIKTATAQYNTTIKQLNSDIETFNKRASAGDFTSQAQFNKERQALTSRSNSLATDRTTITTLITKYDTLKDEYNDTVTQSNDLYKSIDSSLAPAPQI